MIEALLLTIIIELPLLKLFKEKDPKVYFLSLIMNIVTNLSLNGFLKVIDSSNFIVYSIVVIILEIIVVFVEALGYMIIYKRFKKSFIVSLVLNLASGIIGTFIYSLIFVL